jgi:hypothetical protein
MSALERVGDALREHGCRGGDGIWACPAHEDRSPSLSVREGDDGRVLVHCFAGCATHDVIAAVGLRWTDLFEITISTRSRSPRSATSRRPRSTSPRTPRGRLGPATWDDLFWAQADDAVDDHLVRLVAQGAPTVEEIDALLLEREPERQGVRRV